MLKTQEYQYKYAAMLSFCFQIFYLLYSLSGNCLYDMTFYLYIIAMAITGALNFRIDTILNVAALVIACIYAVGINWKLIKMFFAEIRKYKKEGN